MLALVKLVHVLSAGLFSGAILALLVLQSLVFRATEEGERKLLARTTARACRALVMPVMYAAYLSGLAYFLAWLDVFKRMPYVHVMLLTATLAVGMAEVSRGKARRLSDALDAGKPFADVKSQLDKGWLFALVSLGLLVATFAVAILKVPMPRPH